MLGGAIAKPVKFHALSIALAINREAPQGQVLGTALPDATVYRRCLFVEMLHDVWAAIGPVDPIEYHATERESVATSRCPADESEANPPVAGRNMVNVIVGIRIGDINGRVVRL